MFLFGLVVVSVVVVVVMLPRKRSISIGTYVEEKPKPVSMLGVARCGSKAKRAGLRAANNALAR